MPGVLCVCPIGSHHLRPEQSLSVQDLDVHMDKKMFFGMSEGYLDSEMNVKIFKLKMKGP